MSESPFNVAPEPKKKLLVRTLEGDRARSESCERLSESKDCRVVGEERGGDGKWKRGPFPASESGREPKPRQGQIVTDRMLYCLFQLALAQLALALADAAILCQFKFFLSEYMVSTPGASRVHQDVRESIV